MGVDLAGYSRQELTAKRATAQQSSRTMTLILAGIAAAIMAFNAGRGTVFLIRLGAPVETAWLGSFIADAGLVAALVGTWYMNGDGGRSGWLTATVWGTAVTSWVLTVGSSIIPAHGPANVPAVVVFTAFPALLVLVAHSAGAIQQHAAVRVAEFDEAIRRAPRKAPTPVPEAPTPVRTEPPVRKATPARTGPHDGRPTRDEVVAELAAQIRTDPDWMPDYPALAATYGYARSWNEKTVSLARTAAGRLHAVGAN